MPVDSGVWAAPGRVNLIGEHTDYNEGFVLPFALQQRTAVTANLISGPRRWVVSSSHERFQVTITPVDLTPGRVAGWAGYVAGVIWALHDAGFTVPATELQVDSNVPIGAGLSSSAALQCAVLSALCDLAAIDLPTDERPRVAQRAENVYAGVPCGIMDQAASTLCRPGHALFLDCRSLVVEHIPFDLDSAGLAMVVVDSRTTHRHVDNEYAERRRTCERAARNLGLAALRDIDDLDTAMRTLPDEVTRRRVRHVVTENQRVLDTVTALRDGRWNDVGRLMTASHLSMRDDYQITVPEVDLAVDVALHAGALGARMTGGGFGGCVLALVDKERATTVRTAVAAACAGEGFREPVSFLTRASAGAHRVR